MCLWENRARKRNRSQLKISLSLSKHNNLIHFYWMKSIRIKIEDEKESV